MTPNNDDPGDQIPSKTSSNRLRDSPNIPSESATELIQDLSRPGSENRIIDLTAVFYRSRIASLDHPPLLDRNVYYDAIDQLFKHQPFQYSHEESAVHIRQFLTLLAEALRSFSKQVYALEHDVRNRWYEGVTNLYKITKRTRRDCPAEFHIEHADNLFFLKHIQYLVLSIKDGYSGGEKLSEFGGHVIRGALYGYSHQFVEAADSAKDALSRKRKREEWHSDYIGLEQRCFTAVAQSVENGNERARNELGATIALRNALEKEIVKDGNNICGLTRELKALRGRIGQSLQSSGQYEEHDDYFKYGLIDLMYFLSFRVRNRKACFDEMIGAVHEILERFEVSDNLLRKIIDLYRQLNYIGKSDGITYGKQNEHDAIKQWITEHQTAVESPESSKL